MTKTYHPAGWTYHYDVDGRAYVVSDLGELVPVVNKVESPSRIVFRLLLASQGSDALAFLDERRGLIRKLEQSLSIARDERMLCQRLMAQVRQGI
ncbi:hypothetical protein Bsp3421_000052 (plasmid) [Burkholderia sp. FERM BP-3421]|uniref:hypothetical protein n=1 Tax=Burkholderia sp. FERM BP-3421 TaxID=1494466 RepID=UPI00235F625E|nr:hypothetical protein [Burkholderia sp. FERM BP-3421]WDD90231.1 hypothetical protein Bsp3421_000052 [Burkholderia sp. FERM BP-3421]